MKRSYNRIIYDILTHAGSECGKTDLMTKSNLTSSQFQKYLKLLTEKKLICEYPDEKKENF